MNPVDPEHQRMVATVDEVLSLFAVAPTGEDIQGRAKELALQIVEMSLTIIRHEWTRVLKGT